MALSGFYAPIVVTLSIISATEHAGKLHIVVRLVFILVFVNIALCKNNSVIVMVYII